MNIAVRSAPRRLVIALLGGIAGACVGVVAILTLRACSHLVVESVRTGTPFETLAPAERAAILRLRRLPPQAPR